MKTTQALYGSSLSSAEPSTSAAMTVKTETVSDIYQTVHGILSADFCWFDQDDDPLVVECGAGQVRVFYLSRRASPGSGDTTFLDCRFNLESSEMWIGSIQVAASYRRQGLGQQLVQMAEEIADAMEIGVVTVFPLTSSQHFWGKMGYTSKPRTARVLWKHLTCAPAVSRRIIEPGPSRKPPSDSNQRRSSITESGWPPSCFPARVIF